MFARRLVSLWGLAGIPAAASWDRLNGDTSSLVQSFSQRTVREPTLEASGDEADNDDEVPSDQWELDYDPIEWQRAVSTPFASSSDDESGSPEEDDIEVESEARDNLCMDGHLVPEFFNIGIVKASTTSFATDLERNERVFFSSTKPRWLRALTDKEGHHFDYFWKKGKDYFLGTYPKCNRLKRSVAVDASPRYLNDPLVPARIARTYGRNKDRLKFMIIIREPVGRLHSDFYYSHKYRWCKPLEKIKFKEYTEFIMNGTVQTLLGKSYPCKNRARLSYYKDQLERWLEHFNSSQFIFVPWRYNTHPGQDGRPSRSVAEWTWDLLGVGKAPRSSASESALKEEAESTHRNTNRHPALHEDLDETSLRAISSWFDEKTGAGALADLLSASDMHLYEYSGARGDKGAIAEWITAHW